MNTRILSRSTLATLALAGVSFAQLPSDGLRLWLDASDPATIVTSGGKVTEWLDKSGNAFNAFQTDPLRQPSFSPNAFNGVGPALHFDGAATFNSVDPNDDGLFVNNALNITGRLYSIFIVDQYWGTVAQGRTLQGADQNWLLGKWNGNNSFFSNGFNGLNGTVGPVAGIGNPVITEGYSGGGQTQQFINGAIEGRTGSNGAPGRLRIANPANNTGTEPFFSEASQSDVGAVIAYDRPLSDVERRQVTNYLSNQFGTARPFQGRFASQTVRFTGADPGEGLDFQGTFVAAVNGRGPGGFAIGDALFTDDSGGNPNAGVLSQNEILPWGGPALGPSANDSNLNTVMNSIRWSFGDQTPAVTATVNGLVPGRAYKLQTFHWEACCGDRHFGLTLNGDVAKRDIDIGIQGRTAPSNAGVALVTQFVADSATLSIQLTTSEIAAGDRNPILNGFTVEDLGIVGTASSGVISSPASLDLAGSFLYALDFANGANGSPGNRTVDGLTFTPAEGSATAYTYAENTLAHQFPNLGATPDADALEDILTTIRWESTDVDGEALAVDLLGLTIGQQYKLQLLFGDDSSGNRAFDIVVEDTRIANNFSAGALHAGDATKGAYWTFEFTAGDSELNILLDGAAADALHPDHNPILSGLTLEIVPEPGSAALILLGAASLATRRRRTA